MYEVLLHSFVSGIFLCLHFVCMFFSIGQAKGLPLPGLKAWSWVKNVPLVGCLTGGCGLGCTGAGHTLAGQLMGGRQAGASLVG